MSLVLAGRPGLSAICRQPSALALFHAAAPLPQLLDDAISVLEAARLRNSGHVQTSISTATIRLRTTRGTPSSEQLLAFRSCVVTSADIQSILDFPRNVPGTPLTAGLRQLSAFNDIPVSHLTQAVPQPPIATTIPCYSLSVSQETCDPKKQLTCNGHSASPHPSFDRQMARRPHLQAQLPNPSPRQHSSSKGAKTTSWALHGSSFPSPLPRSTLLMSRRSTMPPDVRSLSTSTAVPAAASDADGADVAAAAVRDPSRIRNFAIIAHIDHGKTTLMDRLLAACGHGSSEDRAMDSHSLERERGITILAKVTSFTWGGFHINAVDTPGHADFGGEVERVPGCRTRLAPGNLWKRPAIPRHNFQIAKRPTPRSPSFTPPAFCHFLPKPFPSALFGYRQNASPVRSVLGLVDGCVLLVDAAEGPLAQTKYVVAKALERGLKPLVVLNKVDRPAATPERCAAVANSLLDLFVSLGASDEQLDFPLLYASAKQGWSSRTLPTQHGQQLLGQRDTEPISPPSSPPSAAAASSPSPSSSGNSGGGGGGMAPLLDAIVAHVPSPAGRGDLEGPFALRVAMIERDPYVGRIATGACRIASGKVRIGDKVRVLSYEAGGPVGGEVRITRISKRAGMDKIPLEEAVAGDIVSVAGPGAASIADTIASPELSTPLDPGRVDPPTLAMVFGPNDSPLAGRAGKALTGRAIGERLMAEAETSVSLKVVPVPGGMERYEVQARGELQLGVLIEGMRREGAELAVSPPQVLLRREGGQVLEPVEEVVVEVAEEVAGSVIEALSQRRAELTDMTPLPESGKQRLTFVAPSRGLIGFKSLFVHLTRGEGIMTRVFMSYSPHKGPLGGVRKAMWRLTS
ncbi:elongation factor-like protein [Volvox carteri f. nagariensis]|uniref:Elongation factor-like protein n=1 Tax=Volvox carteri f. nagariensis TaxID=3068 RepID=D8UA20_VOLCA|nr:elongation factor-like protein [Volvox carteri f. nagariensis]EFJ43351.1 elongation factor-like protein [Volvox carteri f. nagariensis]|eukprot:XP_002955498.1 elongation factor-like protein [Volvox carteri f. nagariensis]